MESQIAIGLPFRRGSGGGGTIGETGTNSRVLRSSGKLRIGGGGGGGGVPRPCLWGCPGLSKATGRPAAGLMRIGSAPDFELAIGRGSSSASYTRCWSFRVAGIKSEMIVTPGNEPSINRAV